MNQTFEQWMEMVDRAVWRLAGASAYDLTDYCYRDAYDSGESPGATARRAIAADRGEDEE